MGRGGDANIIGEVYIFSYQNPTPETPFSSPAIVNLLVVGAAALCCARAYRFFLCVYMLFFIWFFLLPFHYCHSQFYSIYHRNRINTSRRLCVVFPISSIHSALPYNSVEGINIKKSSIRGERFFINMRKICQAPLLKRKKMVEKRSKMYTSVDTGANKSFLCVVVFPPSKDIG